MGKRLHPWLLTSRQLQLQLSLLPPRQLAQQHLLLRSQQPQLRDKLHQWTQKRRLQRRRLRQHQQRLHSPSRRRRHSQLHQRRKLLPSLLKTLVHQSESGQPPILSLLPIRHCYNNQLAHDASA